MSATLDTCGWWEHVAAFQAEVPSPLHPSADQIMGEYFLEMRSAAYRDNAAEILRLAALICDRACARTQSGMGRCSRIFAHCGRSRAGGASGRRKQAREFGAALGSFSGEGGMSEIGAALSDPNLLGRWFGGEFWRSWRTILRGVNAERLTQSEASFFRSVTDRDPPRKRMREVWIVAGQRSGKGSVVSGVAAHAAASFEFAGRLRPGEVVTVAVCAVDKSQAAIVKDYIAAYFHEVPALKSLVLRETATGFELRNSVSI